MEASLSELRTTAIPQPNQNTIFPVLAAISFCHLLNDMMQSLLPAIYPILKSSFRLDFGQVGLITLTYQLTASLLQPLVGFLHGSPAAALFAAGWDGIHPHRPYSPGDRSAFRNPSLRSSVNGDGVVRVSSGVVPSRADGFGRSAGAGSIGLSGWRKS